MSRGGHVQVLMNHKFCVSENVGKVWAEGALRALREAGLRLRVAMSGAGAEVARAEAAGL